MESQRHSACWGCIGSSLNLAQCCWQSERLGATVPAPAAAEEAVLAAAAAAALCVPVCEPLPKGLLVFLYYSHPQGLLHS